MRSVVVAGVTALTLLAASGTASAAAGDRCTWHGLPCNGGGTLRGTVTGKGWNPPRDEYHSVGKGGHVDHLAECWRLDLRWGPFRGWVCTDRATWNRTHSGDQV